MSRTLVAVVSVLSLASLAFTQAALPATQPTTPPANGHAVRVSTTRPVVALGDDIPVSIIFQNQTKEDWNCLRPETSMGTLVKYALAVERDDRYAQGYFLGKVSVANAVMPDGQVTTLWVHPVSQHVLVKPGGEHRVETDLYASWSGDIRPGTWAVWFTDEEQGLRTERVEFRVVFSKASVPAMLRIVGDISRDGYQRKWHAEWLAKLRPGFPIQVPAHGDAPEAVRAKEAAIVKAIQHFRAAWEKEKDTEAMTLRIEQINAEAEKEALAEFEHLREARSVP